MRSGIQGDIMLTYQSFHSLCSLVGYWLVTPIVCPVSLEGVLRYCSLHLFQFHPVFFNMSCNLTGTSYFCSGSLASLCVLSGVNGCVANDVMLIGELLKDVVLMGVVLMGVLLMGVVLQKSKSDE